MLAESVGMGSTHGEKAARLRGMIELLDNTISKLKEEHTDQILNHWPFGFGGMSDYPYRAILEKLDSLKRENEELKLKVNEG
jgi:hypothetical protein